MRTLYSLKKLLLILSVMLLASACSVEPDLPQQITVNNVAQNPEGIAYDANSNTFFLSSLNAKPILKIEKSGKYTPFTYGEDFPLSTAGLEVDQTRNRLLVAGFNAAELLDKNPNTKGVSYLRVYNLETGELQWQADLSLVFPNASAYFANDIAIDNDGNAYISDWYAGVIYKVDVNANVTVLWQNSSNDLGGPNGLDFHHEGYLLVSLLRVDKQGLYRDEALVKIPLKNPKDASIVDVADTGYAGFDGMVILPNGNIVGITNNQKTAGGNVLMQLSSDDHWKTAKLVTRQAIKPSTTLAFMEPNYAYVIHQDFQHNFDTTWRIERIHVK